MRASHRGTARCSDMARVPASPGVVTTDHYDLMMMLHVASRWIQYTKHVRKCPTLLFRIVLVYDAVLPHHNYHLFLSFFLFYFVLETFNIFHIFKLIKLNLHTMILTLPGT